MASRSASLAPIHNFGQTSHGVQGVILPRPALSCAAMCLPQSRHYSTMPAWHACTPNKQNYHNRKSLQLQSVGSWYGDTHMLEAARPDSMGVGYSCRQTSRARWRACRGSSRKSMPLLPSNMSLRQTVAGMRACASGAPTYRCCHAPSAAAPRAAYRAAAAPHPDHAAGMRPPAPNQNALTCGYCLCCTCLEIFRAPHGIIVHAITYEQCRCLIEHLG